MRMLFSFRILCAALLIVTALGATAFVLNSKSMRDSAEIAASLSATTGELAAVYMRSATTEPDKDYRSVLKDLIRRQAMILVTLNLDVREFDSAGFEGICRVASNRDLLFPVSKEQNAEALSNHMLNFRFAALEKAIAVESMARASRPADRHSCPGFRESRSIGEPNIRTLPNGK